MSQWRKCEVQTLSCYHRHPIVSSYSTKLFSCRDTLFTILLHGLQTQMSQSTEHVNETLNSVK